MIQTINRSEFTSAFHNAGMSDNFSYKGLKALFDYLEHREDETGEQIELDVISLCCDYIEETFDNIKKNYSSLDLDTIDDLRNHTQVILVDDTENPLIIYQNF